MPLRLLPPDALLRTSEVDHARWNYRPLLGLIQRTRFRLVLSLLGALRFRRLLEIGFGSGVFMPELARYCQDLYGLDVHDRSGDVARELSRFGPRPRLVRASATAIPFADRSFDGLVAVSAVEFIPDLDRASQELRRVLEPGGVFVVVTPSHSPLADLGLKLLTGKTAREDYGDRRTAVLPTLLRYFEVLERRTFPRGVGPYARLYTALKLRPPR